MMLKRNSINVHSNTRPQLKLQNWETAGRIGDFGNFLNGLVKSKPTRTSIVLYTERVQFVLQNCEILLHSARGLYDKNGAS